MHARAGHVTNTTKRCATCSTHAHPRARAQRTRLVDNLVDEEALAAALLVVVLLAGDDG
jgi:5-deoxy-D-glucuronate isomerase